MPAMSRCLAWVALIASVLGTLPARADDSTSVAARLGREARAAYEKGDFEAAARAFEESHRLVPRAAAIYNAALAREAQGEKAIAADHFAAALERDDLPADEKTEARARLDGLRRELALVLVEAPPKALVSLGRVARARPPLRVHLEPGRHDVVVIHPGGKRTTRALEVGAGESRTVVFELPAAPPAKRQPHPVAEVTDDDEGAARRIAGWVSIGIGTAALVAAIPLGVATVRAADEFNASDHRDADQRDEAVTLRLATNLTLGGAALGAALGVVLVTTALPAKRTSGVLRVKPLGVDYVVSF
jgi:tetratricopeptide (TPR) repeat protein